MLFLFGISYAQAQEDAIRSPGVVTSFYGVWDPPAAEADLTRSVHLTGQVYYCDPRWGMLWLHDGQVCGYIDISGHDYKLKEGDRIDLRAKIQPGQRAVDMTAAEVTVQSPGILPDPVSLPISELRKSSNNNLLIKTRALVQSVEFDDQHLDIQLAYNGGKFDLFVPIGPEDRVSMLEETLVELVGVLAVRESETDPNVNPTVFSNHIKYITVLEDSLDFLFNASQITVHEIKSEAVSGRVLIEGRVISNEPGKSITVRDATGEITVPTWQKREVLVNAVVQVSMQVENHESGIRFTNVAYRDYLVNKQGTPSMPWQQPIIRMDEISRLSSMQQDKSLNRRVMGVVTGMEPKSEGTFVYLQDATGASGFFLPKGSNELGFSDWVELLVELGGEQESGMPIVKSVLRQSPGALPVPTDVSAGYLASGNMVYQLVKARGIVLRCDPIDPVYTEMVIQQPTGIIKCRIAGASKESRDIWLESLCQVRGVCLKQEERASLDPNWELFASNPGLVHIEQPRTNHFFEADVSAIRAIKKGTGVTFGKRNVIQGVVTYQMPQGTFYLADETGGILVKMEDEEPVAEGDFLRVSGFPIASGNHAVLHLAKISRPERKMFDLPLIELERFSRVEEKHVGLPVRLAGTVAERLKSADPPSLHLLCDSNIVPIEIKGAFPDLKVGTKIEAEVIYLAHFDASGKPVDKHLVLTDLSSIEVIESPPLFKVWHVVIVTVAIGLLTLQFWIWNIRLRQRVKSQVHQIETRLHNEVTLERKFESLVESAHDCVFTCSDEGSIITLNQFGQRMLGYFHDELDALILSNLLGPESGKLLDVVAHSEEQLVGGKFEEVQIRRRDGTLIWCEIGLKRIPDPSGNTTVLGILRDVSWRKEAEQELLDAKQAAEAADHAKSRFLANMSHEIRTPLSGVIGMAEILADSPLSDEQKEFVEAIRYSGSALLSVINDILDISKIEAECLDLDDSLFNLQAMLEQIVESLDPEAARKGLKLSLYVARNTPEKVIGDELRMRQVLWNLLGNAIKFTSEGSIAVEVHTRIDEVSHLEIFVRDTGIGMSDAQMGRIFQPFSQADSSTTRQFGGTGLGLAISQRIALAMKGSLNVHSTLGKGSEFMFSIPLRGDVAEGGRNEFTNLNHRVAVLVGDEQLADKSLQQYLTDFGFDFVFSRWNHELVSFIKESGNSSGKCMLFIPWQVWGENPDIANMLLAEVKANSTFKMVLLKRRNVFGHSVKLPKELKVLRYPLRYREVAQVCHGTGPERSDARRVEKTAMMAQQPLTVLVADDNAINQKLIQAQLKSLGHACVVVADGQALLDQLDQTNYDLIFLDCQMPVLDGYETSRRIRQLDRHKDAKIFAFTAAIREEDRQLCTEAGMDGFLSKPIQMEELKQVLATANHS